MIIQIDRDSVTTQIRNVDSIRILVKCGTCKDSEWRTIKQPSNIKCKCHYEKTTVAEVFRSVADRELKAHIGQDIADQYQNLIDYYTEKIDASDVQITRILDQMNGAE